MPFKVQKHGIDLKLIEWSFPGGEVGIRVDVNNHAYWRDQAGPHIITARITSSDDVMKLELLVDAIRRHDRYDNGIVLIMPYIPYARQDRVCEPGDSHSLVVFAHKINHLMFDRVLVCDPHSAVAEAVFDNLMVMTQIECIAKSAELVTRIQKCVLLAPDAGALKKTMAIAKYVIVGDVAKADKIREMATGKILGITIDRNDFKGRDVFIADDICDGGRTFIELAAELRKKNVGKIILYTTHGIFSKGTEVLIDGGIDELWTTDSYMTSYDPLFVHLIQLPLVKVFEDRTI